MPILDRLSSKKLGFRSRVAELGEEITAFYAGRDIVALAILKGSVIFLSDLIREIATPVEIGFVTLSSYGSGTTSTRQVRELGDLNADIAGRDVLSSSRTSSTRDTHSAICWTGWMMHIQPR